MLTRTNRAGYKKVYGKKHPKEAFRIKGAS